MTAFNRIIAVLGLVLASTQAQAVPISFSFVSRLGTLTQGSGNSYTYTDPTSGVALTATGWWTPYKPGKSGGSGNFQTATLSSDSLYAGLGVCAGTTSCATGTLDNASGGSGMILFSFSAPVSLQALNLQQFNSDSDLNLWAGTSPLKVSSTNPSKLDGSAVALSINNIDALPGSRSINLTSFSGTYNWIAVAAGIGQIDDFAKLTSLTVATPTTPVSETATWVTMLAGVGLIGFRVRRRIRG